MRAGIDVGGTFTDLALWDGSTLTTAKVPTSPSQDLGVVEALRAGGAHDASLVHGTTVATNALLERSGAKTALVTDAGFEDLIEIGRQDRPSLYDLRHTRPESLVPSGRRLGVPGRGSDEITPDHRAALEEAITASAPEAVAIAALFGFSEPTREQLLASIVAGVVDVPVCLSSDVAPEFREYERISTTVINAYLVPLVREYLERLGRSAGQAGVTGGVSVMRSSGGLIGLDEAATLPASIVLSGPAGGVVAAAALGGALGLGSLVSFDMGGTSTDVCRIVDGRPEVQFEQAVGGLPNRMPSVAVHTVGAGGGSIAWIDSGGALRVGPRSSGARPGPASYGHGGIDPTVTDADLVIGRLGDGTGLGDRLRLRRDLALEAIGRLADRSELDDLGAATGVVDVVESHMERAIRVVSIEQGADPRDSVLVAFGGAGGMHATSLARRLDMAAVLIPPHAGVFSALGLLLAPPRADVVVGLLLEEGASGLADAVASVGDTARARLQSSGSEPVDIERLVDLRYRGQSHELSVRVGPELDWRRLVDRFHDAHRSRFGFERRGDPVEAVAVRATALGRPPLTIDDLPEHRPDGDAGRGTRTLLDAGGEHVVEVWWRPGLAVGDEIIGPAVIEEPEATTFVGEDERAVVDATGTLEVTW